ncbi:MAG: CPBP family intramembrane metalloprotease, partial [Oscillospiraceae bacterium]|nr:CPBP family intramembrane metalloprotease [Oscillospiraceae bacterium]
LYQYDPDELEMQKNHESQEESENKLEINPRNPFQNETEFMDYNSDYGEIVPQIRMKGCKIPLFPNQQEKRRIHRYENIVGGFLLGHLILMNVLALILMRGFTWLQAIIDSTTTGGNLPANYSELAWNYFENSSSYIAITMLAIGSCSIFVTWFGCKITKIPVSNLFQTRNFHIWNAVTYIGIALCIQTITGYLASGITDLLSAVGVTAYEPDLTPSQDIKAVLISFIYSVIVAPITEELLVRGFVMKNLCRVSQHFGIIASAFFFGVWHENIAQFVLAFCAGCFFGYITVKHNSLIPSIIAHMAVNFCAEMFSICEVYHWEFLEMLLNMLYLLLVLVGIVLLIRMFITERFPKTTPEQAERGGRLALTSPLLMIVFVCHIGSAIFLILQETIS